MTTFPDNHLETRLIKAAEQISKMPAAVAEKAMEDIAHKNGDDFLQTILAHISPLKIADMLKRNDFSNPSILTWIMTPWIISQVIKKLPLFWMGVLESATCLNSEYPVEMPFCAEMPARKCGI